MIEEMKNVRLPINDPEHPVWAACVNFSARMGLRLLGEDPSQYENDSYQERLDSYLED